VAARQQQLYRPDYGRVHGLFVGIGEAYADTTWPRLNNPAREVDAVIAQLQGNDAQWRAAGAAVRLVDREATYDAIHRQLARLEQEAGPDDAVLVYFAGHGARQGDSFGLCAADVRGTIDNGTGYVRRETLTTFLKACRAKHVLVVLDCCHSGAVFDVERGRDVDADDAALPGAHHRQRYSREFLCSAGAGQPAADGADLSPFCARLLQELRQTATPGRDFVAARYLAGRIGEAMDAARGRCGMQLPAFQQRAADPGSFVFRLAAAK
jgi:hypothetical protein